MNENWNPETWGPKDIEFQGRQYLGSRVHATAEMIDALRGIGPRNDASRAAWGPSVEAWAVPCGIDERYVLRVSVFDEHANVTCPRCRALMRAIRPEAVPLHERRPDDSGNQCYFVGGEQVSLAEYTWRLGRPSPYSADDIEDMQIPPGAMCF